MDDEPARRSINLAHDPSRVLTLSDGVFAIILTLLVLEIHVPELTEGTTLGQALEETRPSIIAFLISFVVVAISWAGHRDLFALVRRTDPVLVWLNLTYLLPLSLVPFGASLLARYEREPIALAWYGVLMVAIEGTRIAIWLYATNRPTLLFVPAGTRFRLVPVATAAVQALAYAGAIALAEGAPRVTLGLFFLIPTLYFWTVLTRRVPLLPDEEGRS